MRKQYQWPPFEPLRKRKPPGHRSWLRAGNITVSFGHNDEVLYAFDLEGHPSVKVLTSTFVYVDGKSRRRRRGLLQEHLHACVIIAPEGTQAWLEHQRVEVTVHVSA